MEERKDIADLKVGGISANELKETATGYYEDFQDRVADADRQIRSAVSARPLACVAGAFAIGFLAAKSFRMWRR
ncbi:MAG: hypothetical protein ABL958_04415 [Bdellovibrionia bacterium]